MAVGFSLPDSYGMAGGALYPVMNTEMDDAAKNNAMLMALKSGQFQMPQQPQAPEQAPIDPSATSGALMGPGATAQGPDIGALYQQMKPQAPQGWQPPPIDQHGNASNAAITQLGIGLLSGKNLQEGLATGLSGANKAYDDRVALDRSNSIEQHGQNYKDKAQDLEAQKLNKPTVTSLGNGIALRTYPDGRQEFINSSEWVDRTNGKIDKQGEVKNSTNDHSTSNAITRDNNRIDRTAEVTAGKPNKETEKDNDLIQSVKEQSAYITDIEAALADRDKNHEYDSKLSMLPTAILRNLGDKGADVAARNSKLDAFHQQETLANGKLMSGPMSDGDRKFLSAAVPDSKASSQEWKVYLDQKKQILQRRTEGAQQAIAARQAARTSGGGSAQNQDAVMAEIAKRGLKL
jgi:hypothetical protein